MKTIVILYLFLVLSFIYGCSPPDPESPPASAARENAIFDELLQTADESWSFLFTTRTQVLLTDIHGQTSRVMFDLWEKIHTKAYFKPWEGSISPDGRYLLIYYDYRESTGSPEEDRLIFINTQDWSGRVIPVDVSGYDLNWSRNAHWFSDETFIVPINRFDTVKGGSSKETVKYLMFNAGDLTCKEIIEFDVESPILVWGEPTKTLLYTSSKVRRTSLDIRAWDILGKRTATSEEKAYFNEAVFDRDYDPTVPVPIEVQIVVPAGEGWGEYWEKNNDRYYILLDGVVKRCSDSTVDTAPKWDADLQLFIWHEWKLYNDYYFYMDKEGHYRRWFDGYYLGKIPQKPS